MSQLDTLARQHADAVTNSLSHSPIPLIPPDIEPHRTRRYGLIAAIAAVIALIAVPLTLQSPSQSDLAPPTQIPIPENGLILNPTWGPGLSFVTVTPGGVITDDLRIPLPGPTDPVWVDWSWMPDGRELAQSDGSTVGVIDTVSGTQRQLRACETPCSIAASPDGSEIAVLESGSVNFIDPNNGTLLRTIPTPDLGSNPGQIIWSTDGKWLILNYLPADEPTTRLVGVHPDGSGATTFYEVEGSLVGAYGWSAQEEAVVMLLNTSLSIDDPSEVQLSVVVARPDSEPRHVADVGRCFCLGLVPGMTTSPDGSLVAMNIPGMGSVSSASLDDWGLYVMGVDGSDPHIISAAGTGNPIWQPRP